MSKSKLLRSLALFLLPAFSVLCCANFLDISDSVRNGINLAVVLSLLNALLGFLSVIRTFQSSNKVFYGVFFGNMLWKLGVLAGLFFYLLGQMHIYAVTALVTLALMTFAFNILELKLLLSR